MRRNRKKMKRRRIKEEEEEEEEEPGSRGSSHAHVGGGGKRNKQTAGQGSHLPPLPRGTNATSHYYAGQNIVKVGLDTGLPLSADYRSERKENERKKKTRRK